LAGTQFTSWNLRACTTSTCGNVAKRVCLGARSDQHIAAPKEGEGVRDPRSLGGDDRLPACGARVLERLGGRHVRKARLERDFLIRLAPVGVLARYARGDGHARGVGGVDAVAHAATRAAL
jgi:hypothetical protein